MGLVGLLLLTAMAQTAPAVTIQPYVQLTVQTATINIQVNGPGDSAAIGPVIVKLAANTANTGLIVSATPLVLATDPSVTVPPGLLQVQGPLTNAFVALASAVNVTGPMTPGIFSVPLYFRFSSPTLTQAGMYTGTVIFTAAGTP
jgi:hypothetical protein